MAKGQSQQANNAIDRAQMVNSNMSNQLYSQFQNQYQTANEKDQSLRDTITSKLSNFDPHYDVDSYYGGSGGGGGVSDGGAGGTAIDITGGIDPSRIDSMGAEAYGGYRQLAQGLGADKWASFDKYKQQLGTAIDTDTNFAKTGGFSQGDLDNIRARSVAPTRAIYQQGMDQLARQQNMSGNNLASTPAAIAQMARNQNQAISDNSVNTEASIAQQQSQNKLAGAAQLQQAVSAGMSAETAVNALDAQMRAQGLGGMTDIEKSRLTAQLQNAQINQQGSIAKAQIAESAASRGASASAAAASIAQAQAQLRFNAEYGGNQQRLAAAQGLTSLYGTTPGATALANQSLLTEQGLTQAGQLGLINAQLGNRGQPVDWGRYANTGLTAAQYFRDGGSAAAGLTAGAGNGAALSGGMASGGATGSLAGEPSTLMAGGSGGSTLGTLGTVGGYAAGAMAPFVIGSLLNPGTGLWGQGASSEIPDNYDPNNPYGYQGYGSGNDWSRYNQSSNG
jgi:hypothetical protein